MNNKQFVQSLYRPQRFETRKDTSRTIVSFLRKHGAKENMVVAFGKSEVSHTSLLSILRYFETTGKAADILEAFRNNPSQFFRALSSCRYCPEVLHIKHLRTIFDESTERARKPYDYIPTGEKEQDAKYLSLVREARERYYLGEPIVSNLEYDILKQIALAFGGAEVLDFENDVPITFAGGVNTLFSNPMFGRETTFLSFPNIDGLRVTIRYENGYIKTATTLGVDIAMVINEIHGIPKNLKSMKPMTIEGVLYVPKRAFYNLNHERRVFGQPAWSDMKTGLIQVLRQRPHDLIRVFDLDLSFMADGYSDEDSTFDRESERFELLRSLGFPVLSDQHFSVFKAQEGARIPNNFCFFTEGIVVRLNRNDDRSLLGGGDVVYKRIFPCQTKKVTDISYTIGKGSFIFPVATIEGSLRIGLESFKDIKELDLRVGDTIIYSSQPHTSILSSARDGTSSKIRSCDHCPKCGGKVIENNGIFYCTSRSSCRTLTVEEVSRFTGPQGFNIRLLGHSLIAELIEKNVITTEADILNMRPENHDMLERTTKEVFDALLIEIGRAKANISLKNFLYALNIPLISYHVAQHLEERFGSWAALTSHRGSLDIEAGAAKELATFLKEEKETIQKFFDSGVTIVEPQESLAELCSKKDYTKRHFKLIEEKIREHTESYDISDKEYDMLSRKYDELAKEHPGWVERDGKNIIQFSDPLVFLKKTSSRDDLDKFIKKVLGLHQYVCIEPKVDGFACSLHYKNGKLVMGTVKLYKTTSHDVTDVIMKMKGLPKTIKNFTGVVRGEVYISKKHLAQLNTARQKKGLPTFKHTVPALVAMIRSGNVSDKVRFFAFHIEPPGNIKTRWVLYSRLERMGFDKTLYPYCRTFGLADEIDEHLSDIAARKAEVPVDIDGLVLKINDLHSDIAPIGYKFPVEHYIVEVDRASPSKTGTMITFNSLKLEDGKEVSKIIVENKVLPLNRGDKIRVGYISGSQPFFESIIEHKPVQKDEKQTSEYCLNCSRKLKPNSEGVLQCFNWRCSSQKLRDLFKFCKTMGIKTRHSRKSLITLLSDKGLLSKPSDLYRLTPEDLNDIPEHIVRLFLSEIANSRTKPLHTFIGAFNIGNIHPQTIAKICSESGSLANLITKNEQELTKAGLARKSAKLLNSFFVSQKRELEYFISIGMGETVQAKADDINKGFEEWKKERTEIVDLLNLFVVKAGIFMTKTKSLNTSLRSYKGMSPQITVTSRAQDGIRCLLKYTLMFMKKLI